MIVMSLPGSGLLRRLRIAPAAAALTLVSGLVLVSGPSSDAAVSPAGQRPAVLSPNTTSKSLELFAVAALSARDAWPVGSRIEHWTGRQWSVQAGAKTGKCSPSLHGVSAASPSKIWAVGTCFTSTGHTAIIERWNGRRWTLQAFPRVGTAGTMDLNAVKATSASNAWAVGESASHGMFKTLIEHWNGRAWKVQASPSPGLNGTCR